MTTRAFNVTPTRTREEETALHRVEAWAKLDVSSFRLMSAASPRTGNPVRGLFFQTLPDRSVWSMTTPKQGGPMFQRVEDWLEESYLAALEAEKSAEEERARGDAADGALEAI